MLCQIVKVAPWCVASIAFVVLLGACSPITVNDYKDKTPKLNVETFFEGRLSAHGVVKNRSGKVIRHFNAKIHARWDNGIGTLDEYFVFDDGEQQQRIWTLTPDGAQRYIATAGDVVGPSTMRIAGNSLFLNYVLQVPYNGKIIDVAVDDRMYLVDAVTLLNESVMTKWGFKVGEVLLVIKKLP
ncbi:DUF3833 domain-containing protein [Marinagarivorans algicola]|uniref:DUF3833 domain-containing protein n=1 Tax=Marinagarivorans algicola TaxID=1513270 RepID=UPI0006B686C4|nr:DUF3833 domain-containing protein [Marinagarivorans algicola]